jgi:hypothetical protein
MSFIDWPGAGPTPEPEPEGFREEQSAAERQRQLDEQQAAQDASLAKKQELTGNPDWPAERPAPAPETSRSKSKSATKSDAKDSHHS